MNISRFDINEIGSFKFKLLTHLPLVLIVMGVTGNIISFLVFTFHREFKNSSTMVYLSLLSVTDTLSLWGWNFDHYLLFNRQMSLFTLNKPVCKISLYLQFTTLESSAFLLAIMTIDRYVHVVALPGSFLSKLPLRSVRSAYVWSIGIIFFTLVLNSHIIVFACHLIDERQLVNQNDSFLKIENIIQMQDTLKSYSTGFSLFPVWEQVHMAIYIGVPFIIMVVANTLLMRKIIFIQKHFNYATSSYVSFMKKISITLSILMLNVYFLITSIINFVVFTFFFYITPITLHILIDSLLFSNHCIIFFSSFITNTKFRRIILSFVHKWCLIGQIARLVRWFKIKCVQF